jgi:predicted small lipoprotein YifL
MVRPSTLDSRALRANRSLRMGFCSGVAAALLVTAACGKKGPPLAPFARVPAQIATVTPQRIGNDVYLSFTVPDANADGEKPADIGAVDVYAVTSDRPPATEEAREVATLIATLPVRPILPDIPIPANGSAPPPLPLPPGVDRGAAVAVREPLTAEARVPVELPVEKPARVIETPTPDPQERIGPLVAPAATQLPRRHYFLVAKSPRGRESGPSSPVSVPLEAGSSAPGAPAITHSASDMTITWTPPPDARTSTFLLPPTVKPVAGANATPGNVTPVVPPPLPPLAAKSLGFNTEATTYHVYDVTPVATEPDPYAIALPKPVTPAPVVDPQFVIKGVAFGVERCFEVRPVDNIFGTVVIGPSSPRTCVTPKDTFPPTAPKNLAAIAGTGVISLIWDPNTESDLAGYVVLRGEGPGDTLQAITPQPVTVTSYRDETVKPGTHYVYVVVAVDRAEPQNVSPQSNRAEETARQ